jgi:hypothetical protein
MPGKKPPLLVFLVDAFRHDFLHRDVTPNLFNLAGTGIHRPLQPILGYSDAIRATFFTGRWPDETGYWMEYCYRSQLPTIFQVTLLCAASSWLPHPRR